MLYTEYGYTADVSIEPIGSVTSGPTAIEPIDQDDPIVETITNAETPVAPPATLATEELPPTGAAPATLSAINAQLNNTDATSGLLAQSYAAVALLSGSATLQTVYGDSTKPAIAPVEPIDPTHKHEDIESG